MQLTERDYKILEFLTISPSNSNVIADYLSASLQVVQRRLLKLYEGDYIQRWRVDINSNYIYFVDKNKPKDLNHMLTLSKLYLMWTKKGYKIELFKREVVLCKGIRCDGLAVVNRGSGLEVIIIEVDTWTRPQDKIKKYEQYQENRGYKSICDNMPLLLFVTNKSVKSKLLDIQVIKSIVLEEFNNK